MIARLRARPGEWFTVDLPIATGGTLARGSFPIDKG